MALRGMPRFYWQRFQVLQAKIVDYIPSAARLLGAFQASFWQAVGSKRSHLGILSRIFGEMGGCVRLPKQFGSIEKVELGARKKPLLTEASNGLCTIRHLAVPEQRRAN